MFDWITWSIWSVGFLIMVIWIVVPYREFRRIQQKLKERSETDRRSAS